jgi:hypothetical protein
MNMSVKSDPRRRFGKGYKLMENGQIRTGVALIGYARVTTGNQVITRPRSEMFHAPRVAAMVPKMLEPG